MRIKIYGPKWAEEKIKQEIRKRLGNYTHISEVGVYLYHIPNKCMDCIYFPCREKKCKEVVK